MTAETTRSLGAALFLGLLAGEVCAGGAQAVGAENASEFVSLNKLTPDEAQSGWKLLFNGNDLTGWRAQDSTPTPSGWVIRDTALSWNGTGPNAILSNEAFGDFELVMDWRVGRSGDAGIFLRVWNDKVDPSHVSPEVQLVDNLSNTAAMDPKNSAGACNHLYAPSQDATLEVGLWNRLRVVARGSRIEHWLNDAKVVDYEIGSADWKSRLGRSTLKSHGDLGTGERGYLALQSGTTSRFRNMKIRPLGEPLGILSRGPAARRIRSAPASAGLWITAVWGARDAQGRSIRVGPEGK